jgi:hypothetical protein
MGTVAVITLNILITGVVGCFTFMAVCADIRIIRYSGNYRSATWVGTKKISTTIAGSSIVGSFYDIMSSMTRTAKQHTCTRNIQF